MKDALWLLGSALAALAICAATMTIVIRIDRPAAVVQQARCTGGTMTASQVEGIANGQ